MKYTLAQLREIIQPMIATALDDPRPKTTIAVQLTEALVELFSQDREAWEEDDD